MNIVVPIKFVPDLVEELEIDSGGAALDRTFLRLIINEFDDHALEQALLLKEHGGGSVTAVAFEVEGADDALYTAAAKGVDHVVRIAGDFSQGITSHAASAVLVEALQGRPFDLILTGTQANDDLDGSLGPLLAARLGLPYVGYVTGVEPAGAGVLARKEYPGGLLAEMEVDLPAVLGIQAAEKPPRYVVTSLITQAMKTTRIEEIEGAAADSGAAEVARMFQPEPARQAEMIEGEPEQVARALAELFRERGLIS